MPARLGSFRGRTILVLVLERQGHIYKFKQHQGCGYQSPVQRQGYQPDHHRQLPD